jgi:hypothetical protein
MELKENPHPEVRHQARLEGRNGDHPALEIVS